MIAGVKRYEKEGYKHKWGACWVNGDKEEERKTNNRTKRAQISCHNKSNVTK